MRRTLLSILVAIASFAVTSFVIVGAFSLVAGSSTGPTQGSSARAPEPSKAADPVPANSPDVSPVTASDSSTGPLGGAGIGLGPASGPRPTSEPTPSAPKTGVLSQDFRELGLDDPTTVIDESLRSACDVVGGTIAGPALCNDR
jgi:hypothetical protein